MRTENVLGWFLQYTVQSITKGVYGSKLALNFPNGSILCDKRATIAKSIVGAKLTMVAGEEIQQLHFENGEVILLRKGDYRVIHLSVNGGEPFDPADIVAAVDVPEDPSSDRVADGPDKAWLGAEQVATFLDTNFPADEPVKRGRIGRIFRKGTL